MHLIYFALAAFDLLAIVTGLWLSEYTKSKFEQSIAGIEGVNFLVGQSSDFHALAAGLLAPANDIFADQNPEKAKADLKRAEAAFFDRISEQSLRDAFQKQFGRQVAGTPRDNPAAIEFYSKTLQLEPEVIEEFERIQAQLRTYAKLVTATAEHAIAAYAGGNIEIATVHMQKSDAAGRRLQTAIIELGRIADKHLARVTADSKRSFNFATRVQYAIGLAILAMVLMVMAYAHFIGKILRGKYDEIVEAHSAAAESARQLQQVNNHITALNSDLAGNMRQLNEAQDELLRKQKMAQLGQLIATVAHELRNPLAAVRTSAFLLERKLKGKEHGVEPQIQRIANGVQRCDNIISQLLDFSRARQLSLDEADFDSWLAKVVEEEVLNLPAAVSVECHLGLGGRRVGFDSARMNRTVINLLANASEAMVGKGNENPNCCGQSPKIRLSTRLTSRGIELAVEDNGPGMAAETLARIREPLFTTKSFGTGLGIPAIEKIMEQHGGGLEVWSEPGRGARFTAWWPAQPRLQEVA